MNRHAQNERRKG
jgi:hypothetical protein